MIVGRDESRLSEIYGLDAALIETDVSTFDGAEHALKVCVNRYGRPDALVHCAGSVIIAPLHRTSESDYRQCMAANADSVFFVLRAYVNALRNSSVMNRAVLISSVAAQIGIANHEAIAAAKGAIEALVRSAAATYGSNGFRINAVAPGLIATPAMVRFLNTDAARSRMAKQYPLGRYGETEDIVSAIIWLLSDEASWVTGQTLNVDGGFTAVRPLVS